MEERRQYKRFGLPLMVECRPVRPEQAFGVLAGRTADISLSGVKVRLPDIDDLQAGDPVRISIDTFGERGMVEAEAEVCWSCPCAQAEGEGGIGFKFTQMSPSNWSSWFRLMPWK